MTDSQPERFVSPARAKPYWAKHAYEILVETAGRYNAVITYGELAEEVQRRARLWTRTPVGSWVPGLLRDLVGVSHLRGEPALTSLVVHKEDGQVGNGYDEVLRVAGLAPIADPIERETHAATTRLECYNHWGADVPADAQPTLTPRARERQSRARAATPRTSGAGGSSDPGQHTSPRTPTRSTEPRRGAICPTCFMEMPLSGVCINCS